MRPRRDRGAAALLGAIMLAAAASTAAAYWPGLMTSDAMREYDLATGGSFDDWHPPVMEWLWRLLTALRPGPAPMLVLQLALYWGGFALLAGWALKRRRTALAAALTALGLLPLSMALMGAVLKDCLMSGALLVATGLLVWSGVGGRRTAVLRVLGLCLLLFAATLRFNAFLACVPLAVALLPEAARRTRARIAVSAALATLAMMLAMPIASRLLHAEKSGVELSLVIFDLGGITENSGVSVFPPMGIADPVAANRLCYTPLKWDAYSDWVSRQCPLGYTAMRAVVARDHLNPYGLWLSAILRHPIAYAEHRLAHFNINTRFLVTDEIERPVQVESVPNPWGYRVQPSSPLSAIDRLAVASASTPLGWPIVWIALAAGVLAVSPSLPSRRLIVPIALSALLYGLGYFVFSVAVELRYHLWTMIGTAIATALVANDLTKATAVPWRKVVVGVGPALVVATLALVCRLQGGGG